MNNLNETYTLAGSADPYLIIALLFEFLLFLFLAVRVLTAGGKPGIWNKFDPGTARSSPHYIQGFHYLISGQRDAAINEFRMVAECGTEAPEVYLVLGNLYREKGLLDRAIRIHKSLLKRKNLQPEEETLALFSLAADFEQAGFIDRAARLFKKVLEKDPGHTSAIEYIANLYEKLNDWESAFISWERLLEIDKRRDKKHVAFLRSKIGENLLREGNLEKAEKEFTKAVKLHPETPPAYINLGEVYLKQGKTEEAVRTWEEFIRLSPEYTYLVIKGLDRAYEELGQKDGIFDICRDFIDRNPSDWRIRVFLADKLIEGRQIREGMKLLLDAVSINPSNMTAHIKYLEAFLDEDAAKEDISNFLSVIGKAKLPETLFECLSCRYRTDELLWHCPHCQEWDTFVEV